ncbi:hypothetical protein LZ30DRAFT_791326, partial [Colletotrichum cereale]
LQQLLELLFVHGPQAPFHGFQPLGGKLSRKLGLDLVCKRLNYGLGQRLGHLGLLGWAHTRLCVPGLAGTLLGLLLLLPLVLAELLLVLGLEGVHAAAEVLGRGGGSRDARPGEVAGDDAIHADFRARVGVVARRGGRGCRGGREIGVEDGEVGRVERLEQFHVVSKGNAWVLGVLPFFFFFLFSSLLLLVLAVALDWRVGGRSGWGRGHRGGANKMGF